MRLRKRPIFPFQMRCLELLLQTRSYEETAKQLEYPPTKYCFKNDGTIWVAVAVFKAMGLPKDSALRASIEPLYRARQKELIAWSESTFGTN